MAALKSLYVEIGTNIRPLTAGLATGADGLRKFGKDVLSVGVDLDVLARKAETSARRVIEAQLRMQAAQARVTALKASGAQPGQQANAQAALMVAERNLARATEQSAAATAAAERGIANLGSTSGRTRNILSSVALVAGGALVGGMAAALHAAVSLETSLHNIASISPEVAGNMAHYRELLLTLSDGLPQSANELAAGMYQIVSSGFEASDAVTVLRASAEAASAGLSTTGVAATAIAGVLKAYGYGASQAADVSDTLFRTVQDGVVTFEQLAQGVGDYIGTGAAAQVKFGELGAAISAMTLSGVTAAESGTSLNQVLQRIVKPSDALNTELRKMGYLSGAQALASDGLYVVMEKLRKSTGGNVESLLRLFPEIRAARGAFALMAADGQNYTKSFNDIATINGRVGATQKALAEQAKSPAYQISLLRNEAVHLGIEMAQTLLPALEFVVGGLKDFLGMLNALPGPVAAVVGILAALSGAALLGVGAFIRFRAPIAQFRQSLATMRAEGSRVPGALTGLSVAAGAVTAALIIGTLWYGHYAAAKAKAKAVTDDFVAALKDEQAGQKGALQSQIIKDLTEKNAGDLRQLQKQKVNIGELVLALAAGGKAWDDFLNKGRTVDDAGFQHGGGGLNTDSGNGQSLQAERNLNRLAASYANGRTEVSLFDDTQKAASAATSAASGALAGLTEGLQTNQQGTVELTEAQKGLRDQLGGIVDAAGAAKQALTSLTDPAKVFTDVQQQATAAAQKAAEDRRAVIEAGNTNDLRAAQDRVAHVRNGTKAEKQAAQDNQRMVERHNKDRLDALDKGVADQKVSLSQWTAGLRTAAKEQAGWEADLTTVARRAGVDVADSLRGMGKDAIPLIHQLATGSQTEVDQVKKTFKSLTPDVRQSLGAFTAELTKQIADQAAYVGNLVTLTARGHGAIAEQFKTMPIEQAAPLAAQAASASDKQLAPLEAVLKRRAAIIGDGTAEALALAVEHGMLLVSVAAEGGAKATVDALLKEFGSVDKARLYLLALKGELNSLPARKTIDVILNMLPTTGTPVVVPNRATHGDSDYAPGAAFVPKASGSTVEPVAPHTRYALGGINLPRQATVAPGRGAGLVQWAEGSTGGEAFIPLGAGHRVRSTHILSSVARHFGYAMLPTAGGRAMALGGSPSMPAGRQGQIVARLATEDVERVAMALSRMLPRIHQTEFSGPIYGLTIEQVRAAADKAERLRNLGGL